MNAITMKLIPFLSLIAFGSLTACDAPQHALATTPEPPAAAPVVSQQPAARPLFVTWDKKTLDLGKVHKGEKRQFYYDFINTSGQDIQIDIVDACACTTIDFPRGVIHPNGKGRLGVEFDSSEKDASETIGITVVFKNTDANGNPVIESLEYKFELE